MSGEDAYAAKARGESVQGLRRDVSLLRDAHSKDGLFEGVHETEVVLRIYALDFRRIKARMWDCECIIDWRTETCDIPPGSPRTLLDMWVLRARKGCGCGVPVKSRCPSASSPPISTRKVALDCPESVACTCIFSGSPSPRALAPQWVQQKERYTARKSGGASGTAQLSNLSIFRCCVCVFFSPPFLPSLGLLRLCPCRVCASLIFRLAPVAATTTTSHHQPEP